MVQWVHCQPLPHLVAWLIFAAAAILEVGGDAIVRRGLRRGSLALVAAGLATVALYGLVVNMVTWDFSKVLGVYVAFFAVLSILSGRFLFRESVPPSTWFGLLLIVLGGLVIQLGEVRSRLK